MPKKKSRKSVLGGRGSTALITGLFALAGLVLFAISGWMWRSQHNNNPERAFWSMVNNSLSSPSVTKTVSLGEGSNEVTQVRHTSYSPQYISETLTDITETNESGVASTVRSRMISTMTNDYISYEKLDIPTVSGQPANVDDILNVWGVQEVHQEAKAALGSTTTEALINIIPFGDLLPKAREELVSFMRDNQVYRGIDEGVSRKIDGRDVIVYRLTVPTKQYAELLQRYAKALGFGEIGGLDPTVYTEENQTVVDVMIDKRTKQLTRVTYGDESRIEEYHSQGLRQMPSVPPQTVSFEELQNRLTASLQDLTQ